MGMIGELNGRAAGAYRAGGGRGGGPHLEPAGVEGGATGPNGYLHAATVVALTGTSCGHGTFANLPDGAERFTTIELESIFLGTARRGDIECKARRVHGGRTAQVWYATVTGQEKTIALPHCAQMILHPR